MSRWTGWIMLVAMLVVPKDAGAQRPAQEIRGRRSVGGTVRRVPSVYPTIQSAVDASDDGDLVLLADGLYRGSGNQNVTIDGKSLTLRSENGPLSTQIAPAHGRAFYISAPDESTVVGFEGLTIKKGDALGAVPVATLGRGGAILVEEATLRLDDCILEQNTAQVGGAVALLSAFAEIRGSTFRNNRVVPLQSSYAGGGALFGTVSSVEVRDSLFVNNSTNGILDEGGAVVLNENPFAPFFEETSVKFVDCVFRGNSALADGGGMKVVALDEVTIDRCLFEGNSAGQGGALTIQGSYVTPNLPRATVSNSIISDNAANFNFAGISIFLMSEVVIRNSTIARNRITGVNPFGVATTAGIFNNGSALAVIENSILWGNDSFVPNPDLFESQVGTSVTQFVIRYNDIEGNVFPDNIGANPLFVDPDGGDYRLRLGSLAIDAGDPAFAPAPGELDFHGSPRVLGLRVDMGAAEWDLGFVNHRVRLVPAERVENGP